VIRSGSPDTSRLIGTNSHLQNKPHAHLFGEERVDAGFKDQCIDDSSMADREPTLTVDKNGQRHVSQMVWINRLTTGRRQAQYGRHRSSLGWLLTLQRGAHQPHLRRSD
jgi:hypothetical protein